MCGTDAFSYLTYNLNRVEAFYTEICEVENGLKPTIKQLSRDLAVVQLVAIADAYRASLMTLLLEQSDVLLRNSQEAISYQEILDLGSWGDLRSELVRRQVDDWMSPGYGNWINRLGEKCLPSLNVSAQDWNHLEEIIATRNVLIHNKGCVDEEYLRRTKHWYGMRHLPQPKLGETRQIDTEYFTQAIKCIKQVILLIEKEAATFLSG
ncbi:hypothetical protein [Aggregatilinea lenta]|uniref:hypothetical protein n=1 Tax=Aggregatilinea lenta TaxID=913108 RepID=UPI000E5AA831|nr:hypothetical protein [Aggregatilinea lenta]